MPSDTKQAGRNERPAMAPDRPGRYLRRDGQAETVIFVYGDGFSLSEHQIYRNKVGGAGVGYELLDIIARAPDDQAWLAEQARAMLGAMDREQRGLICAELLHSFEDNDDA